jgi:L-2,4-diaminobutyrate decarboxylase
LGIIAYAALKYYGNGYYGQYIDSRYDLAAAFSLMVKSDCKFQLTVEPESNIVCFRFAPKGYDDIALNRLNSEIRERIIKEGSFYIVQVELDGKIWLRLTIINPVTSEHDLKVLIRRIAEIGESEAFKPLSILSE